MIKAELRLMAAKAFKSGMNTSEIASALFQNGHTITESDVYNALAGGDRLTKEKSNENIDRASVCRACGRSGS